MNKFKRIYSEIAREGGTITAFFELREFLEKLTQHLSTQEAFALSQCLMTNEEMIERLIGDGAEDLIREKLKWICE